MGAKNLSKEDIQVISNSITKDFLTFSYESSLLYALSFEKNAGAYSINSKIDMHTCLMNQDDNTWQLFYYERGNQYDVCSFCNIDDAFYELIHRICPPQSRKKIIRKFNSKLKAEFPVQHYDFERIIQNNLKRVSVI